MQLIFWVTNFSCIYKIYKNIFLFDPGRLKKSKLVKMEFHLTLLFTELVQNGIISNLALAFSTRWISVNVY